jgi:broad specificity phosphatase PhoE
VSRSVELRRHTDSDGDVLSGDGVAAALKIGKRLHGSYDLAVSSGAQRATQTVACFLAGLGEQVRQGVVVDSRFRSDVEDRWRAAFERAGSGDIDSFRSADPELVDSEARVLGNALEAVFGRLSDGERALVVGHSPMQEVAVFGLTGQVVDPLGKGAGILVTEGEGAYSVETLH